MQPSANTLSKPLPYERLWFGAVLALALVLRVFRLGSRDYWHDEAHTLIQSEHLWDVVFKGYFVSNHPPLFPILLRLWRELGLGEAEWSARMLSVVLGVGTVGCIYMTGRRIFGARAGLAAAFLLAMAPLHVLHSQELKEYIVFPIPAILSVYFLYRAAETNQPKQWIGYGLSAALACYSELFAGPLLITANLWFLFQLRGKTDPLKGWLLSNAAGALLFAPQLPIMLRKMEATIIEPTAWWVPRPGLIEVAFYLKAVAYGYGDWDPLFKIAMALFGAFGLAGVWLGLRANIRGSALLLLWFLLPVAMVFMISQVTQSIFLIRAMMAYAMPAYLFAGLGVAAIPHSAWRGAALGAFAAVQSLGLYQRYADICSPIDFPHRPGVHPPKDYKAVTRAILAGWREGDVVLHTSAATWLPAYWYGLRGHPNYFAATNSGFIAHINQGNPRTNPFAEFDGYYPREIQPIVTDHKRTWLVFSEWERKYLKGTAEFPSNAVQVWRWLDSHAVERRHEVYRGIELFLYDLERGPEAILARESDDGINSELRYAGETDTYRAFKPDIELVPVPLESRRGALRLRFEEGVPDRTIDLVNGSNARAVYFVVENTSGTDVACHVQVVPSSYLIDFASMFESEPAHDAWSMSALFDVGPQRLDANLTTLRGAAYEPEPPSVYRNVDVPAGHYEAFTLSRLGAEVILKVNGVELRPAQEPTWTWRGVSVVTLPERAEHLEILVRRPEGAQPRNADLAYLGLLDTTGAPRSVNGLLEFPMDTATLSPDETLRWRVEVAPEVRRLDVFVEETHETSGYYRIYRILW